MGERSLRRYGIVLLLCLSLSIGCSNNNSNDASSGGGFLKKLLKENNKAVPVTVANALLQERSVTISVPGKLLPSDRIDVRLSYEARIDRIFVNPGDVVEIGDPLVKISEEDINLKLSQIRTELKDTQSAFEKNTNLLKNRDRLLEEGKIEKSEYDGLDAAVTANESKVEKLRLEIQTLESQLEKTTIANQMAGIVEERKTVAGAIAPAGTPLISIIKTNPMLVEFELAAHEATAIAVGQNITVRLPDLPGQQLVANIVSVGSTVNPDAKTFTVKATLPNPASIFKGGMQAAVEFLSTQKQRFFVVPTEAIISDRHQYYVFTVVKGVAHRVHIIPRESRGSITEIMEGLRDDDLLIVKGHENLEEGTVVDIWGR